MSLPKLAFIGTGGTLASVGRSSLDLIEYLDAGEMLDIDSIIERVPALQEVCDPHPHPFATMASMSMGPEPWLTLSDTVSNALAGDVAGVVITHGTATLEETAYFLDLVIDDERPVVLTGAMRPFSGLSPDAHLNIVNAAQVAAAESSRGLGALVVLSGLIHCARYATKCTTYRVDAFTAANGGPVGEIAGPEVHYFSHPPRAPRIVPGKPPLPRVDITFSYAGGDGFAIDAAAEQGAKGIVAAGFAPGDVTPAELEALRRARAKGVEIIQATRTMGGQVLTRSDLVAEGFVAAGRLTPQKARVLAMLGISAGIRGTELQKVFEDAG